VEFGLSAAAACFHDYQTTVRLASVTDSNSLSIQLPFSLRTKAVVFEPNAQQFVGVVSTSDMYIRVPQTSAMPETVATAEAAAAAVSQFAAIHDRIIPATCLLL